MPVVLCQIVLGGGKNKAWNLYHAGDLPFPALRDGRRVVVPVAPILKLLGLDQEGGEAA